MKNLGLIKTSGIVTKTTKYGDTSLIVTILTKDCGKIQAIARNVRTKKSQMLAGLQLFSYSEIVMYKAKSKTGLYVLDEMCVTEGFSSLRYDLEKMAYAAYFAETANAATVEDLPDENVLRVLLNTLYALEKDFETYEKLKMVYEWRLAAESGYSPLVLECNKCGKSDCVITLSMTDGTALCEECDQGRQNAAKLNPTMARIVDFVCRADVKKMFAFEVGAKTLSYLGSVSERYLATQLDREFPTLEYLKKVKTLENTDEKQN